MSNPNSVPVSGGRKSYGWYDGRKAGVIRERVSITDGVSSVTLTQKLPPRCQVLRTSVRAVSALVLGHSALTGTSALADTVAVWGGTALPTTNATSSTVTGVLGRSKAGATSSTDINITADDNNTVVNISPNSFNAGNGHFADTNGAEQNLWILPMDNGGSEDFNVATTPTNGYHFAATGTVDVEVYFEEYVPAPAS